MDQEPKPHSGISRRDILKMAVAGGVAATTAGVGLSTMRSDSSEARVEDKRGNQYPESELEHLEGTITREELFSKYHTRIYDLQPSAVSDYVVLDFDNEARGTRVFKRLESGLHIDIFLVNNHLVDPSLLTQSQKAALEEKQSVLANVERRLDAVKERNREEILQNSPSMREEYHQKMNQLLQRRTSGLVNNDRFIVESQALEYQYGRYLRQEPTDDDLLVGLRMTAITVPSGTERDEQGNQISRSYIFMAVRDAAQTKTFISGDESLTIPSVNALYDTSHDPLQPRPEQSYLEREDLVIDMEAEEYVVTSGRTIGFDLAHELQHAIGVISEKDAELRALDYIDQGNYIMRFRTPQGVTIT